LIRTTAPWRPRTASTWCPSCATAWPPLASAPGAANDGDWTVVTRDDGSKQWAYKGKALYAFKGDAAGKPATGVGPAWPLVVK
jgi:predicted lipoprotein with Yx(FWY)xxD motif